MSALLEGEPVLLLTGRDIAVIAGLAERGLRYMRTSDGITSPLLSPQMIETVRMLRTAADHYRASVAGRNVRPDHATSLEIGASSAQNQPQELTAREAGGELGVSDRQVYRLRDALGDAALGVVGRHPLRFDRVVIEALAARRAETRKDAA